MNTSVCKRTTTWENIYFPVRHRLQANSRNCTEMVQKQEGDCSGAAKSMSKSQSNPESEAELEKSCSRTIP